MRRKLILFFILYSVLLTLSGCAKKESYKVYPMFQDIQLTGVKGTDGNTVFKAYIRPQIGNEVLDSIIEVIIEANTKDQTLDMYFTPYGCEQVSNNMNEVDYPTLDTLQCFKASKDTQYDYLVNKELQDLLLNEEGIKDTITLSHNINGAENNQNLSQITYVAPEVFTLYLDFEFKLEDELKGILRIK
nr:hypothetical protein [uncultured Niameybacter sp.]